MAKITLGSIGEITKPDCIQALLVEFIVTFFFIFAGVGSAMTTEKLAGNEVVGLLFVAMAHAFVVAVMISAGFRISGGHLNPAVTVGLCAGGHITIIRSLFYWIDQLLASVAACALLSYLTGGLIVLTFSLIFTVYATLVDPQKGFLEGLGPLLTGLVVGANIMAGGPFSGASMNPARSFGPALVAGVWTDHWVYWIGPLVGGGLAGFIYENLFIVKTHVPLSRDEEDY